MRKFLISIILIIPFITSVKLCGGIFVAIPTAIPDEPFINNAGTLAGNTFGSCIWDGLSCYIFQ